jgi:predicted amidohydrolase
MNRFSHSRLQSGVQSMKYTVCAVQMETGRDPGRNLEKLIAMSREACSNRPDFLVLPEMFEIVTRPERAREFAHPIPSEITAAVASLAREHAVNIIGGSHFESVSGDVYNTCCVFDRRGTLVGTYRKMHLFDAFGYAESAWIGRGEDPLLCELDGLTFGVALCYDVRFPELFRHYAVNGASIVFVPAAFFQPNHDHWRLALRARAIDNGFFVLGCDQTGAHFVGRSMLADPWGIVSASLGIEEDILFCQVDPASVDRTREKLPLLENRRFDVRGR